MMTPNTSPTPPTTGIRLNSGSLTVNSPAITVGSLENVNLYTQMGIASFTSIAPSQENIRQTITTHLHPLLGEPLSVEIISDLTCRIQNLFPQSTVGTGDWPRIRVQTTAGETYNYEIGFNGVSHSTAWPFEISGSQWVQESSRKTILQNKIKSNLLIKTSTRQRALTPQVSPQELKARETLRDLISEREWRRYITNGFVMIQGHSNRWYQVFKDQSRINVYEKGKLTDKICIHTEGGCPPTDHILNIMHLLQFDEKSIWDLGNIYPQDSSIVVQNVWVSNEESNENLLKFAKRLKVA